ncbi:MAG: DMT family transporter [bacterium]
MFNWVSAEAAALLVSLSFATRNIFIRAGQEYTTPLMSTFAITLITCVFLVPLTLSEWSGSLINWMGVFWFTLAGVTAPGVALLLYFASIRRIGVARASPIASIHPLISLIIAVIFLGERPSIPVYFGTILIVGGIIIVTSEKGHLRWTLKEISILLLASSLWAISTIFRKLGMNQIPWPSFGGLVITIAALLTLLPASFFFSKENRWRIEAAGAPYLLAAGLCLLSGFYFHMFALGAGMVARVGPLANTSPILTVFFTAIFLRRLETVTRRLILATIVILIGVTLITLY